MPALLDDAALHALIAESLQGRQNAHKRATRKDAQAALEGSLTCRKSLSERFAHLMTLTGHALPGRAIELDAALVEAIERYLATDWSKQASNIGALNAVAYIGERVVAIYKGKRG